MDKAVANTIAFYAPDPDAPDSGAAEADAAKPAGASA